MITDTLCIFSSAGFGTHFDSLRLSYPYCLTRPPGGALDSVADSGQGAGIAWLAAYVLDTGLVHTGSLVLGVGCSSLVSVHCVPLQGLQQREVQAVLCIRHVQYYVSASIILYTTEDILKFLNHFRMPRKFQWLI